MILLHTQASTLLEIWQDYREETEKEERGKNVHCVVPEIIHTTPTEGHWKFLGGGGI